MNDVEVRKFENNVFQVHFVRAALYLNPMPEGIQMVPKAPEIACQ
jgi:hypothetical protein